MTPGVIFVSHIQKNINLYTSMFVNVCAAHSLACVMCAVICTDSVDFKLSVSIVRYKKTSNTCVWLQHVLEMVR